MLEIPQAGLSTLAIEQYDLLIYAMSITGEPSFDCN